MNSSLVSQRKKNNHESDFTHSHYRELLQLGKLKWNFSDYHKISWKQKNLFWRHDVDFSLNRSLALAKIEKDESIRATYFINPHSEFYNIFEFSQREILYEILSLGHDVGLHFDASFYDLKNTKTLNDAIFNESKIIFDLLGIEPVAFSFHNPVKFTLQFDDDEYGGLLNCYSKRFKEKVSYCSDSNGCWRFRRLYDVLQNADNHNLQVLTHPGWWHENAMPARQRCIRAINGRAQANIRLFDNGLKQFKRPNIFGPSEAILFIKDIHPKRYALYDYLWNVGNYETLLIELWRLVQLQFKRLCTVKFYLSWGIPLKEINLFFDNDDLSIDRFNLFNEVFGKKNTICSTIEADHYQKWSIVYRQLISNKIYDEKVNLEVGCAFISKIINNLHEFSNLRFRGYSCLYEFYFDENIKKNNEKPIKKNHLKKFEVDNYKNNKWGRFIKICKSKSL
mgnify:CR=1 FL=1